MNHQRCELCVLCKVKNLREREERAGQENECVGTATQWGGVCLQRDHCVCVEMLCVTHEVKRENRHSRRPRVKQRK